ncbi:hypothetical protein D3C84_1130730 [compost metagenome]
MLIGLCDRLDVLLPVNEPAHFKPRVSLPGLGSHDLHAQQHALVLFDDRLGQHRLDLSDLQTGIDHLEASAR